MKIAGFIPRVRNPTNLPPVEHERCATRKQVNAEVEGGKRCFVKEVVIGYRYDPATMRMLEVKTTVDSR